MKKTYDCFEKGHGTQEKKNCFQEQNRNRCTKQKKVWWDPRILFYKHKNNFAKVCTKQAHSFFNLRDSDSRDYNLKLS